jgi:hypothetical protein
MLARDNPFRSERIEALAFRDPDTDLPALLAHFRQLGHRGVLVGPHGSGKTTLRETLERHLEAAGWIPHRLVLATDRRARAAEVTVLCADLTPRHLLCLDGLDLLGPWLWWRLRRAGAGGILATSHRPGRLPTLLVHRTSPALLAELVAELAGPEAVAPAAISALFARHGGDVRACLRELYDTGIQA